MLPFLHTSCEGNCFGCIEPGCPSAVFVDDACPICLELIRDAPALRLLCGHAVHMRCITEQLHRAGRWKGRLIKPAECRCPSGCGALIAHPALADVTTPMAALVQQAAAVSAAQAAEDGMDPALAEHKYSVYQCHECDDAFSGGLRECDVEDAEDVEAVEGVEDAVGKAICEVCRRKGGSFCWRHGREFMPGKCNYCCEAATFNCGAGRYLFCTPCHVQAAVAFHEGWFKQWEQARIPEIPACDPARCAFGGAHPGGPGVATYGWHAKCSACHNLNHKRTTREQPDETTGVPSTVAKCATPGCGYGAHAAAAAWNGNGTYCCAGCMEHAAKCTLTPERMKAPPEAHCHEARCLKAKPGESSELWHTQHS